MTPLNRPQARRQVSVTIGQLVIHGYEPEEAKAIAAGIEAGLEEHLGTIEHTPRSRAESSRTINATKSAATSGHGLGVELAGQACDAITGEGRSRRDDR